MDMTSFRRRCELSSCFDRGSRNFTKQFLHLVHDKAGPPFRECWGPFEQAKELPPALEVHS